MDEPLLDLRVYKYPMFALASVIAIVNAVAMFSGMILTPAYVQNVRGISPLSSGGDDASRCGNNGDYVTNYR